MSAADDIGKSAVGGPTAVVVELARGLLTRAFRPSKKTVYKIDGQRVSGPEFRARIPVTLPGQRPAPPGKMPPPQVAAPVVPPIPGPPSNAEWEARREAIRRREPPKAPKPNTPPPNLNLPRTTLPKEIPTTAADRLRTRIAVPPRATAKTLQFAGKWLRAAGWTGTIIYTVEWIAQKWQEYFPGQPLPDGPPPPRRGGPGSQGGKGTNRPNLPPQIIVNVPAMPAPNVIVNLPAPPTVATPMPAPVPRAPPASSPAPAPRPAPAPAPTRGLPAWAQYAPALLPLLLSSSKRKKRKRPAPGVIPGIPGLTPGLAPGLGLAPTEADFPLFSGGNYFDSTPQQRNCDCGPKKKRRPKKKRTKCFTGRFTERASGLRKYDKRSIKCR
jgi:hypothetical protein